MITVISGTLEKERALTIGSGIVSFLDNGAKSILLKRYVLSFKKPL